MRFLVIALALLLSLALIPGVEAAAEPVPGVSVIVSEAGDPAFVFLRFYVSPDDPDQDTGSYTYNVTLDAGSGWVDLGEVTDINGGIGSELLEFTGSTFSGTFNVTADDGTGPVDSCTVTIDTSIVEDHDACGDMDPDNSFTEYFCLDTDLTEGVTGFNYERRVSLDGSDLEFAAGAGGSVSRLAVGALNLGGDVDQLRLSSQFRFESDFLIGGARVFFSSVDVDVSSSSFGDGVSTGAFSDGIEFIMEENGNEIGLEIRRHTAGAVSVLFPEDTDFLGSGANTFQAVNFTIHPDSGTIQVSIGASSHQVVTNTEQDPFHSLWISEGWRESGSDSRWASGTGFCLETDAENPAEPGLGGAGQGLEDFDGEGGFGGDPAFPGVSIDDDNPLGVSQTAFALVMAAVLVGGSIILAWQWSMMAGAIVGGVTALATAAVLNLVPLWSIVLVFLLAVSVILLWRRS